jgi:hypothetical protein
MRYLFLVIAAFFVIGCGKSPVQVENHYYFSGETLRLIQFKDYKMNDIAIDDTSYVEDAVLTFSYIFPLPADFDLTYKIILPRGNSILPKDTALWWDSIFRPNYYYSSDPLCFLAAIDSIYYNHMSVMFSISDKNILCSGLCWIPMVSDSSSVIQEIKNIMNKSWVTYFIQKPVDFDSL